MSDKEPSPCSRFHVKQSEDHTKLKKKLNEYDKSYPSLKPKVSHHMPKVFAKYFHDKTSISKLVVNHCQKS